MFATVLPGGGARGAYQAGVLRHLSRLAPRELGIPLPLEILCGTSIGAFNAAVMAAFADDPESAAEKLCEAWLGLQADVLLRPDPLQAFVRLFAGRDGEARRIGVFDERALLELLAREVSFPRLHDQIRQGRVRALAVSATHVASGTTTVFLEQTPPAAVWSDPSLQARAVELGPLHLLASAAIPLLFPPVAVGGQLFCEGGLRQNVPLAPALRLGARKLVVITPHHLPASPSRSLASARVHAAQSPFYLAGKLLNALLLDRVDADVERLRQLDLILAAGRSQFGPDFVERLNRVLPAPLTVTDTVVIRASESLGRMAAEFVSSKLGRRRLRGLVGRSLSLLGRLESAGEADLVSYLLFDGEFARWLIDLGERDARAQEDDLCRLLLPRKPPVSAARRA